MGDVDLLTAKANKLTLKRMDKSFEKLREHDIEIVQPTDSRHKNM